MKRLATILGGVLAILLAVHLLDVGWSALFDMASPLRLGVVVGGLVGALLLGEVARIVRLPRIVGYLAVGVILGPFAAHFAERNALDFPRVIDIFGDLGALLTGAVSLVGLALGLRIRGGTIARTARSMAAFVVGPPALIAGGCAALLYTLQLRFEFVSVSGLDALPVVGSIVVGLLLATPSPMAAWGTNAEFHAEGGWADAQLQVSVITSAVIGIALLAIVGGLLFDQTGTAAYSAWIADFGQEVGFALAAGLVAGGLLLAVLRWAQSEVVPVSIFLAILTAVVAPQIPGFAFIGGIVAGAVVATGSQFSHAISESLDRGAPAVLAVAVLHVGLLLDLPVTREIWLLAVVLVVARMALMVIGSQIAIRVAALPDTTERMIPLAALSQGYAPLMLAILVTESLPGASGLLYVVTPVILIDAVIGPVLHRRALVRMGQRPPAHLEVDAPRKRRGHLRRSVLENARTGGLDTADSLLPRADFDIPEFESVALTQVAERVRARLNRTMDRVAAGHFDSARKEIDDVLDLVRRTIRRHVRDTLDVLDNQPDPDRRIELLRSRRSELDRTFLELFQGRHGDSRGISDTLDTIFRDLQRIGDLPSTLQAPALAELWEDDLADTLWVRLRKFLHRVSDQIGPAPARAVPVRTVGTQVLVHGIIARLEPAVNMVGQKRLYLWHKVEIAWSELDSMYTACLDRIDRDAGRTADSADQPETDEAEELAEFERRLTEGDASRDRLPRESVAPSADPLLDREEPDEPDDPIAQLWRVKLDELALEHERLESDVYAFEADSRRRMALAFADSFADFVWALRRAGTFLLPTRSLEPRGATYHSDAEERTHSAAQHWRALVDSHLDRRAMRLQLRIVQAELHPILDTAVDRLSRELASHLTYYPAEISERCKEVASSLIESIDADASLADLLDAVVQLRASTNQFLQDDALQDLHEVRQTNRFAELLDDYLDDVKSLIAQQPETFSLPSHDLLALGETQSAAHIDHVAIPFRQILERSFVANVSSSLGELELRIRSTIDQVASGLGEVNRVVSFNLDAAASELRTDRDDDSREAVIDLVAEFAVGGIRRAARSATDLLDSIQDDIEDVEKTLVSVSVEHLTQTRDLLLDDSATSLANRAQEATSPQPDRKRAALRAVGLRAMQLFDTVAEPLRRTVASAEERLAFDDGSLADLKEAAAAARFDSPELESLPTPYRRLFAPVPVDIPELFIKRETARSAAERAIDRWRNGARAAIVVSSHGGTGRTSFIHRVLAEELSDVQMVRWNLRERVTTETELAEQLASLFGMRHVNDSDRLANALRDVNGTRLVLIDGLENLYLRTPGGDGAIRALMAIMSRAPQQILWMTTCSPTLLNHLGARVGAKNVFTDIVELEPFDRAELEDLVMRRHKVSGFEVRFLSPTEAPSNEPLNDETPSKEPTSSNDKAQEKARSRYFDRLYDLTQGAPRHALFHWLESLEQTHPEGVLAARQPNQLRTGHLRRLDVQSIIALGQFLLAGGLSEDEFARLERIDHDEARQRLAFLENLGLLERSASKRDHLTMNEVLEPSIRRALRERNLI